MLICLFNYVKLFTSKINEDKSFKRQEGNTMRTERGKGIKWIVRKPNMRATDCSDNLKALWSQCDKSFNKQEISSYNLSFNVMI